MKIKPINPLLFLRLDVIFLDQPSNFDRNYSEPGRFGEFCWFYHPLNRYLTLLLPVSNPFCYYLVPFNTKHFTNLPPDTILLNDDLMDDEMLMLMEEERATLKQQLAACCLRTTDILCVWHCCWVGVLTLTRIMSEFRIRNSEFFM